MKRLVEHWIYSGPHAKIDAETARYCAREKYANEPYAVRIVQRDVKALGVVVPVYLILVIAPGGR